MENKDQEHNTPVAPAYSISEIMALLKIDELAVRKLLTRAGITIDETKSDPNERIRYHDFRLLWVSLANRREGRLLSTLLVEKSGNWFDKMFRREHSSGPR